MAIYSSLDASTDRDSPEASSTLISAVRNILLLHGADIDDLRDLNEDLQSLVYAYHLRHMPTPSRFQIRRELLALQKTHARFIAALAILSPETSAVLSMEQGDKIPDRYITDLRQQMESLSTVLKKATSDSRLKKGGAWKDHAAHGLVNDLIGVFERYCRGRAHRTLSSDSLKHNKAQAGGPIHDLSRAVLSEIDPARLKNRETGLDGVISRALQNRTG